MLSTYPTVSHPITFPNPYRVLVNTRDPIEKCIALDNTLFKIPGLNSLEFWDARPITVITQQEYEEIRDLPKEIPFSAILEKYDLGKVLTLLPRSEIQMKFDAEFGNLPDQELLALCDSATLTKFHLHQLLSDERMEKLSELRKEAVRAESAPLSELIRKYGFSLIADCFSEEEIEEKLEQEYRGKSAQEILAMVDLVFLTSKIGRIFLQDYFGEALKDGPIEIEKEGMTRTIALKDDGYSLLQINPLPEGGKSRIEINFVRSTDSI